MASSCFAATESCVICTLSWVLDWQSCEVSKPFDPLLLDMMVDALCSYHFFNLVFGIMSCLVLLTAFLKHLISQVVILSWSRFGIGM